MEEERKRVAPQFGKWEENAQYTTYFEKAARPNPATRRRGAAEDPPYSPSQSSTASQQQQQAPSPPLSRPSQFRQSTAVVTWDDHIIKRHIDHPNYYDDDLHSSSSSSSSRHQIHHHHHQQQRGGGRGRGRGRGRGGVLVRNQQQQQLPYYYDADDYQVMNRRYGTSAPPTPQHAYAAPTPNHILTLGPGHNYKGGGGGGGGGGVPKFGVWNAAIGNESAAVNISGESSNYTQVFDKIDRSGNKKQLQQQAPAAPHHHEQKPKPRTTTLVQQQQHKPTFLPQVPRRPKSPTSYDHHHNAPANNVKKNFPRCWPFRFSSK